MKKGTKVKLIGVKDRDDKQVYGKILQYEEGGLAIVETPDKVIGLLASFVEKA